jgi:hypothetical protein
MSLITNPTPLVYRGSIKKILRRGKILPIEETPMELWTMLLSWLGGFFAGFVAGYLVKVFRDEPLEEAPDESDDTSLSVSQIPDYFFDHHRFIS